MSFTMRYKRVHFGAAFTIHETATQITTFSTGLFSFTHDFLHLFKLCPADNDRQGIFYSYSVWLVPAFFSLPFFLWAVEIDTGIFFIVQYFIYLCIFNDFAALAGDPSRLHLFQYWLEAFSG